MRCARCDRLLKTPAATVITKAGTLAYGPTCSIALGLIAAPKRSTQRRRRKAPTDQQLPLGFESASSPP